MLTYLRSVLALLLQPARLLRSYPRSALRADLLAGVTVGVVLLPQSLAFSLLAGLPPAMGIYAAVAAAITGALWGSSSHLHTGPTNTASILTLSVLLPIATPGTPAFIAAAGLIAVMAGVIRLAMGLAGLGLLVNFVSDAVAVGFTAGAGILIISNQIEPIMGIDLPAGAGIVETLVGAFQQAGQASWAAVAVGLVTAALIMLMPRVTRRLPSILVSITIVSLAVWLLGLERYGVTMIGDLPAGLPPLADLPLFDFELIGQLLNGALALAIIGLVEAVAIARAVAGYSHQRLDSNQEFVGQGMANIAAGLLSGYPVSGSFNRSSVSYQAGAKTAMAAVFSGLFVLGATFFLGPLVAHLPRAALAGALLVTAYSMIDRKTIARIWRGTRGDARIMAVTLISTLVLPLQFAVLIGVLMSLGRYLLRTSMPRVEIVVPDEDFRHWASAAERLPCPQLLVVDILGDLYFGAANHVEERIFQALQANPGQRFLLLRMHSVQHIDISGIRMLEGILATLRQRGGDMYFVRVRPPVRERMRSTSFDQVLGPGHILDEDEAIGFLFHRVLDPAICIYECERRVFRECQNLPKRPLPSVPHLAGPTAEPRTLRPRQLWDVLRGSAAPLVVDVREPREFRQGHVPGARNLPLAELFAGPCELPRDRPIVLVCRSGRRSARAAALLTSQGYTDPLVLAGGMLAWEAENLLAVIGEAEEDLAQSRD